MKTKTKLLYKSLLLSSLASLTFFAQSAQAELDQSKYKVLSPARPGDTPGKIEVLEFFAYNCPHCMAVEPQVEQLAREMPEDVTIKPVPVSWNAGMEDLQRMYFTIQAVGHPELHGKIFSAIQKDHKITDKNSFVTWMQDQHNIDKQTVEGAMNSFGVTSKIKKASALAKEFNVDGTPTFVVGGKYSTSPSLAGGYDESIQAVRELVEKVRKESDSGTDGADKAADADKTAAAGTAAAGAAASADSVKADAAATAADTAAKSEDKTDEVVQTAENIKARAEAKANETTDAASDKAHAATAKVEEKTDEVSKAAEEVKAKAEAQAKASEAEKAAADKVKAAADKLEGNTEGRDADSK